MTLASYGPATSLSVHSPDVSTYVITMSGDVTAAAVVRVLRLLDARLSLPSSARSLTESVVLDLRRVTAVAPGALVALKHARHACARRGVDLTLAVDVGLAERVAPRDRAELDRHEVRTGVTAVRRLDRRAPGHDPVARAVDRGERASAHDHVVDAAVGGYPWGMTEHEGKRSHDDETTTERVLDEAITTGLPGDVPDERADEPQGVAFPGAGAEKADTAAEHEGRERGHGD